MFKTFALWSLVLLCFLSGCARLSYYFPPVKDVSVSHEQARQQQEAGGFSRGNSLAIANKAPALAALAEPAPAHRPSSAETKALATHLSGGSSDNHQAAVRQQRAEVKKYKKEKQKKPAGEEKKTTKLGKAGFVLSLIGLGSLLLGPALPVFFTLGLLAAVLGTVFSSVALSEIKTAPLQYQDRRKAKAGLILGIITLALYLVIFIALLLLILAFARDWGGGI